MWHKARAQPSQSGAGRPHLLGRPARCWRLFKFCFDNVSRMVGAWGPVFEDQSSIVRPGVVTIT
jgi:hypothetical protein